MCRSSVNLNSTCESDMHARTVLLVSKANCSVHTNLLVSYIVHGTHHLRLSCTVTVC